MLAKHQTKYTNYMLPDKYPTMRSINYIIIHCTATPEGREHDVEDIRRWHKAKGWSDIGYHYLIKIDGTIEPGRSVEIPGAHARGFNHDSIGIVYVGGMDSDMKAPKDTRTSAQKQSFGQLLWALKEEFPNAKIIGHRDVSTKACPSFDAKSEYGEH